MAAPAARTPQVVVYDGASRSWLGFARPRQVVQATSAAEVLPALRQVEGLVAAHGWHAAGWLGYEAAAAFDPACVTAAAGALPLLWFGLYDGPSVLQLPPPQPAAAPLAWRPRVDAAQFAESVAAIKAYIAAGDTYQVNYTFPLHCADPGDPWNFFLQLVQGQQAGHAAFFDCGRFAVCSASPELFFELAGQRLTTRPMKGTAPRGLTLAADREQAAWLQQSAKNRAENLMILDMVRNDLGRIGRPVTVPALFTVEKYPTLWQLTSTAVTETDASLCEIFAALFPCASITGAPKYRTMELIAALEQGPRQIYTGAIGWIAPGRRARFGVAIRTALFDRQQGGAEYRVGAGITWDSDPAAEYRECLDKARILSQPMPPFELLESLLWQPGSGYALLPAHLQRLVDSAEYFDYPVQRAELARQLEVLGTGLPAVAHKVRLLLSAAGAIRLEATPLQANPGGPLRVCLAAAAVDAGDPFLYHKTTRRDLYQRALAAAPRADEVLLWNGRGELTEACNYNLVVELEGRQVTPPVACGLLAGTLRGALLAQGEIVEQIVRVEDLSRATGLWLINSVRGWREARLV